ncbi:MAG: UMP kinase [Magnetococcales bacterium]|nr:UMP kinase [Magnetococcales bacterium]|tara:strand:+ start:31584 stop:32315 length:732 start_codon:yes stop_codon:yes gene_type:complete
MALYKRVLLKLSGERMAKPGSGGVLSIESINHLADEVVTLHDKGLQIGIVLGAGNILRGAEAAEAGFEEAQAHSMGMLATVINALALQSILEEKGKFTRVMTAVEMNSIAEPYIRRRALRHMEKDRIVILAGGTGNPFFTTDSAGALRAIELEADLLVKATQVDGIYNKDPNKFDDAEHFGDISYKDILVDNLKVMDGAAIALCREHNMPLMVCSITGKNSLIDALEGRVKRTLVNNTVQDKR